MQDLLIAKKKNEKQSVLLQFLPQKLKEISLQDYIVFNSQKLKTAYLIDITHHLLLRYFLRKENDFSLSSVILKKNYGKWYNYYISYLIDNGIIRLKKDYSAGRKSRQYSLTEDIINNKIFRYMNKDKILIKKKEKKKDLNPKNKINAILKVKLINSLDYVSLDYEKSIAYLMAIVTDKDTLNRNLYSLDCIEKNLTFWNFDDFGRFHSNFTILKSFIRKNCLLLNGEETVEIDLPNSQPLFLLRLIIQQQANIKNSELELFKTLVLNGELYTYIQKIDKNKKNRDEIKKIMYHVLFGNNRKTSADLLFKKIFPNIYNFILHFKNTNGDYKSLSHRLQFEESQFIYNNVLLKFIKKYPEAHFISVHDSIIVTKSYYKKCKEIFDDCFDEYFST